MTFCRTVRGARRPRKESVRINRLWCLESVVLGWAAVNLETAVGRFEPFASNGHYVKKGSVGCFTQQVRPLRGTSHALQGVWRRFGERLRGPAAHFAPGRTVPIRPFGGAKVRWTFASPASPSE